MTQLDLFGETKQQQFDTWVHTPFGRWVAENFIREAYNWYVLRGQRVGATFVWERLRWILLNKEWSEATRPPPDEEYRLNNNYRPYMARFAVERESRLEGCFEFRAVDKPKKKRPVFVKEGTVITR